MKLTTKRNRWYFWKELFSYMIPMILIVGVVDVFFNFMQCPLHPEWSAPCNVIWINAAGYGFFLLITIILAIFSARKLRKIEKKIEAEHLETIKHTEDKIENKVKAVEEIKSTKPKKIIAKSDKNWKAKKEIKKTVKISTRKDSTTKKKSTK